MVDILMEGILTREDAPPGLHPANSGKQKENEQQNIFKQFLEVYSRMDWRNCRSCL